MYMLLAFMQKTDNLVSASNDRMEKNATKTWISFDGMEIKFERLTDRL